MIGLVVNYSVQKMDKVFTTRALGSKYNQSEGRSPEKKLLFFWILSKFSSPLPLPPIWTTCTTFSDVEIQDLKVSLGLKILYIHYNILYICIQAKTQF